MRELACDGGRFHQRGRAIDEGHSGIETMILVEVTDAPLCGRTGSRLTRFERPGSLDSKSTRADRRFALAVDPGFGFVDHSTDGQPTELRWTFESVKLVGASRYRSYCI